MYNKEIIKDFLKRKCNVYEINCPKKGKNTNISFLLVQKNKVIAKKQIVCAFSKYVICSDARLN